MKLRLLVVLFLIAVSTNSAISQEIKYGITAGFDIATIHTSDIPAAMGTMISYDPMMSYNLNAYIGYQVNDFWGLTIEPGLIRKGAINKAEIEDIDKARMIQYSLQLPILADIYLNKKIFFSLGPEFSYILKGVAKYDNGSNTITDIYNNRLELSAAVGASYVLSEKFDLGLKYSHGFTKIMTMKLTNEIGEYYGDFEETNRYIQVFLRFKFPSNS